MYDYSEYMLVVGVVSLVVILSSRYNGNLTEKDDKMVLIKKYLDDNGKKDSLPILWIYISEESKKNGKIYPYISLCIKSITMYCSEDFNIVTIDDDSLSNIIPNWNIDMDIIPDPMKTKVRNLAVTRILYTYGGLFVPPSFICRNTFITAYDNAINNNNILIGEVLNKNIMASYTDFSPSLSLIGCEKENNCMEKLVSKMEKLVSNDYTNESIFTGKHQKDLISLFNAGCVEIIDANMIGIEDSDGYMVTVDRLLGSTYIPFRKNIYGIYIPSGDIVTRTNYRWFSELSVSDIMKSKIIIGELFRNM